MGSYTSREDGNFAFGNWKSFKLPFPETFVDNSNDSFASSSFLFDVTVNVNFPTAPVKLSGFPSTGSGLTLMDLFPAEIVLLTRVVTLLPNKSLLEPGTSIGTSNVSGSIFNFPVF
jgi:hypothetical protein